jgi:hypothetical protein
MEAWQVLICFLYHCGYYFVGNAVVSCVALAAAGMEEKGSKWPTLVEELLVRIWCWQYVRAAWKKNWRDYFLLFAFCIFFLFAFVSLDFLCKSVSFMWVLILYVEKEKLNQEKKVLLKFSYIIFFVIIDF